MPPIHNPTTTSKNKSKTVRAGPGKGTQGLELSLKTEKTPLHDKYEPHKYSHGDDERRESGGYVSLPELRKSTDTGKSLTAAVILVCTTGTMMVSVYLQV